MIKKPWGVQTDDGREGMMNPNCKTSWHRHSKRTSVRCEGLLYVIEQVDGDVRVRYVPSGGLTIDEGIQHCLFSCGEPVTFRESGTDIAKDIERTVFFPPWADKIISGIRDSHRPLDVDPDEHMKHELPIEGYGRREVSTVSNEADVTTIK